MGHGPEKGCAQEVRLRMGAKEIEVPPGIFRRIRDATRASVLTGAGVSAESGVPTFRGADGIWEKYDFRKLATHEGFVGDPRLVWEWYQLRQIEIKKAFPNPAHNTIVDMEKHFMEFCVLTQNIDAMHKRAGSKNIVELHGNIWRMKCERDGLVVELDSPVKEIPPLCQCGSIMRPDVVWFGEQLSSESVDLASRVARESDVMFVIGTSAVVYPAAALPILTKNSGGLVIEVNLEQTDVTTYADLSLLGRAGDILPALWSRLTCNPKAL